MVAGSFQARVAARHWIKGSADFPPIHAVHERGCLRAWKRPVYGRHELVGTHREPHRKVRSFCLPTISISHSSPSVMPARVFQRSTVLREALGCIASVAVWGSPRPPPLKSPWAARLALCPKFSCSAPQTSKGSEGQSAPIHLHVYATAGVKRRGKDWRYLGLTATAGFVKKSPAGAATPKWFGQSSLDPNPEASVLRGIGASTFSI